MSAQMLPSSPGSRIALLLDRSDVTEAALAETLALPDDVTVTDVLTGRYMLSPTDLVSAADTLDVPVTVLTGQVPMNRHLGVSLRLGSVGEADVPVDALQYADKLLEHQAVLDSWFGRVPNRLSAVSMSADKYYLGAGKTSAARVRDALGLGDEPINDLVGLVEGLGFPVAFFQLPEGIHGLNVRDEREGVPSRVLIVSTRGPWTMQRYTLSHELCHALYDDNDQVIVDRVEIPDLLPELRAESFARHLLLPTRPFQDEVREARRAGADWPIIVARLMLRWGISRRAVVRALVADGLATDEELAYVRDARIMDLMVEAGLDRQWLDLCVGQEEPSGSPLLLDRAVRAFGESLVALPFVAELLGQSWAETERELAAQGWPVSSGRSG